MSKLYGWYSEKQAAMWVGMADYQLDRERQKICIYTTPDGKEVAVTEVTSSPEKGRGNFDDYLFVGEVVGFVRHLP